MPDLLRNRANHGCVKTTIKNKPHLVVFGGQDNVVPLSTVEIYNMETKVWSPAPASMGLTVPLSVVLTTKSNKMDDEGCDMIVVAYTSLYICSGMYQWKMLDLAAKTYSLSSFATIGINDVIPCGMI